MSQAETALFLTIIWWQELSPQRTEEPLRNWREALQLGRHCCHITSEFVNYMGQVAKSLLDPLRSWTPATACLHLMQSTWLVEPRQTQRRQGSANSSNWRSICFITLCCKREQSCRVRLLPFAIEEHSELLTPIVLLWSLHSSLSWRVTGQFNPLYGMQELALCNLLLVDSSGLYKLTILIQKLTEKCKFKIKNTKE